MVRAMEEINRVSDRVTGGQGRPLGGGALGAAI